MRGSIPGRTIEPINMASPCENFLDFLIPKTIIVIE